MDDRSATEIVLNKKRNIDEIDNLEAVISTSNPEKSSKRTNAISWDDYFMAVAFLSSYRSKDPSTQVGACIVNEDKKIVGIGYNGFPKGCSDDELPWDRTADRKYDTKYMYVCHAEVNAILNKNSADLKNCSIYVALFPCNECAKVIIQSGIKKVIYLSDKYKETDEIRASKRMFTMANIDCCQFIPQTKYITINLDVTEISDTPMK